MMLKSVSQRQKDEAMGLLRLWNQEENHFAPDYAKVQEEFGTDSGGWTSYLYSTLEEHNPRFDDNAFLQFTHEDGRRHCFFVYTNDDPLYSYLELAAKPIYASELDKEVS